ncbi:hypothetical protein L226DRAFT_539973 [Lentinus tigrinus ALCF2SS1-7]|uniref:Uncharacterized protein n=1 Tax=Lentinus tigrinus ALCF2SS1-6 TaxID=1328759 RepID=A0A5C2RSY8_9APHY|nr:hypothetical protein L227DRAFT_351384 [Lentinus tigrinus ALCF2SS1-6]RPD69295.1 hypothetical protein L226DRAFT_539973 [Lentinus tigrinus ALCF2SS1-7]
MQVSRSASPACATCLLEVSLFSHVVKHCRTQNPGRRVQIRAVPGRVRCIYIRDCFFKKLHMVPSLTSRDTQLLPHSRRGSVPLFAAKDPSECDLGLRLPSRLDDRRFTPGRRHRSREGQPSRLRLSVL